MRTKPIDLHGAACTSPIGHCNAASHSRRVWALGLIALLAGCGSQKTSVEPIPDTFESVIASGGEFEEPEPREVVVSRNTVLDDRGTEQYFCTTTRYNVVEAPTAFPQFDPNAEVIYPGNLLQGATLGQATPSPIPVGRGPGTIVMTILNGSPSVSRRVSEVTLGSVLDAQNDIIRNASNTVPARFTFNWEEVRTREELGLALDVDVRYLGSAVGASLNFHTDLEYNRFVVKLVQSYFTMVYETPTEVNGFFGPTVTAGNLAAYVGAGNPPAFISSVTYGRIFYLLVESTARSTEIDASIRASFNAAVSGGSLGAGATYVQDLENARIQAYALGGDSQAAIGAITSDFATLKDFLAHGGNIDTGVSLSYVVRSLLHPDRIVSVAVATEYDVTTCVPVGESFTNPVFWYKADEHVSVDASSRVTRWVNSFADPAFDATPLDGKTSGGTLVHNVLNGLPVVRFGPASGTQGGSLSFPGLDFAASDYTVIAVARAVSGSMNYPAYLLFGGGTQPGTEVSLGYRNPSQVTMTHDGPRLDAPVTLPLTQFQVYTFRFSQQDGMSVWVNGSATPAATAPANTTSLTEFVQAQIGSSNGAGIDIAEIKAYAEAIDDAQRQFLVAQLLTKYSL